MVRKLFLSFWVYLFLKEQLYIFIFTWDISFIKMAVTFFTCHLHICFFKFFFFFFFERLISNSTFCQILEAKHHKEFNLYVVLLTELQRKINLHLLIKINWSERKNYSLLHGRGSPWFYIIWYINFESSCGEYYQDYLFKKFSFFQLLPATSEWYLSSFSFIKSFWNNGIVRKPLCSNPLN